jgi:hypothetical protein
VPDSLLLLGFEKDLEDIYHAAGIKHSAVFGEELPGDGRQLLIHIFSGPPPGLNF